MPGDPRTPNGPYARPVDRAYRRRRGPFVEKQLLAGLRHGEPHLEDQDSTADE